MTEKFEFLRFLIYHPWQTVLVTFCLVALLRELVKQIQKPFAGLKEIVQTIYLEYRRVRDGRDYAGLEFFNLLAILVIFLFVIAYFGSFTRAVANQSESVVNNLLLALVLFFIGLFTVTIWSPTLFTKRLNEEELMDKIKSALKSNRGV